MQIEHERCGWCLSDPQYRAYHDVEWGVPLHDDARLFEFLVLEGAQAGLSWLTILRKRENYRQAFAQFDALTLARFGADDVEALMANPGIVRNRLKINGTLRNARRYLAIRERHGSFTDYLWRFVEGHSQQNRFARLADVPAATPVSERMSKQLKKDGFTFVGPTICYAFMQATGMVNDHLIGCFRHAECARLADADDHTSELAL